MTASTVLQSQPTNQQKMSAYEYQDTTYIWIKTRLATGFSKKNYRRVETSKHYGF
jgi:hypothetical protein